MADASFDVVSKVDRQEVDNALNQAAKGGRPTLRLSRDQREHRVVRRDGGDHQGRHRGAREGGAGGLQGKSWSSDRSR